MALEPNDFFENQIKQCRSEVDRAANKRDREFWLQLAHRWERLAGGAGLARRIAGEYRQPCQAAETSVRQEVNLSS